MSEAEVPLELILPGHRTSVVDVENAHWLFLAREPDTLTTAPDTMGYPFTFLVASFLVSDEFKSRLDLVDEALVVGEAMLARPDAELLGWIAGITNPGTIDNDAPLDRLTLIRGFLNDDRTREAVAVIGIHHIDHIDAVNAALAELDNVVQTVAASPLFDAEYYREQLFAGARIANPAAHYVLHGETMGLKPSAMFDPAVYAAINFDVAVASVNRLFHYEVWGRQERRGYLPWPAGHPMPAVAPDTGRPNVLLLLHEATYTGAPILGWNLVQALSAYCNVVVVLRRGGVLENALRDVAAAVVTAPPPEALVDPAQMDRFAAKLLAVYQPLYAIANSVESRTIAMPLRRYDVPIIALVHEFWPGARPQIRLDFFTDCAALVFPARIVEQSSLHAFYETGLQSRYILPQGRCVVPPFQHTVAPPGIGAPFVSEEEELPTLEALLTDGKRGGGPFTVIGLGAVEMRKGVDLFIAAATALNAKHPDLDFRFIWIGTWEHAIGSSYAALLDEQCRRAGLDDRLRFFPTVDNLEPVYARADVLFLSSRLDPLPNITIDAAFNGLPVVCFEQASGTAELLSATSETASLVVPYLDSGAAADRIAALADNAAFWQACSTAIKDLAQRSFDLDAYARTLNDIGQLAARKVRDAPFDSQLIDRAGAFDASIYAGSSGSDASAAIPSSSTYLNQSRHINFAATPVPGVILRRPKAGFHPFIYAAEAPDFPRDGSRNPLVHYVERGMPEGRWTHPVLRLDLMEPPADPAPGPIADDTGSGPCGVQAEPPVSVALHGHFYYADNIADFMTALGANRLRADLFLTTTSEETAEILRSATQDYRAGSVVVEVGPNVGRDIYAFLRVLRTHVHGRYALVGHVHGKRSIQGSSFDPDFGDRWRSFLWQHLLGSRYRAADMIVEAIQRDPRLGLVFPENGYLIGWEKNDDSAATLARRFGLASDLPSSIEFPAGTMFWARTQALEALITTDFQEKEMPVEPIAIDGTILHALERMLPILCEEAGYSYATTYVPELVR